MTTTPCAACPLRRLPVFVEMNPDEVEFMQEFKVGELRVEAATTFLAEGSTSPRLFTVLRGMGLRYKLLENGRRQVVNFVLPGDFVGLQAGLLGEMKHSVEAVTPVTLCVFDRANLWKLFRTQPERAYDLTWIAAAEEHFLGESLATLGQRSATQRLAWALSRLHARLIALGLGRDGSVPFPYRQQDLADALGLSLVHTNKTLQRLRNRQLVQWTHRSLRVLDPVALAEIAMTEPAYAARRPLM